MHSLHEAAGWMSSDDAGEAPRPPDSWQWLTVALFTCSRSCQGSPTEDDLAEEEVVLFNE